MLVPKANGKVILGLNPATINQAFIRPGHRCPISNNILPSLTHLCCLTLLDASSRRHSLKLDENLPYLTLFACQLAGVYIFKIIIRCCTSRTHFLQKKDKISEGLVNVFGIVDDILIIEYDRDGIEHDETLR